VLFHSALISHTLHLLERESILNFESSRLGTAKAAHAAAASQSLTYIMTQCTYIGTLGAAYIQLEVLLLPAKERETMHFYSAWLTFHFPASAGNLFMLCVFGTIAVPFLLWIYLWLFQKMTHREENNDEKADEMQ